MRRTRKGTILPAILLIAIIGGGLYGYRRMRAAAPTLPTYQVAKGNLDLTVRARGEIRAQRSVVLAAPSRIGDVQIVKMVPSGTVITAGDDCIEIDATSERDRLTQFESRMKQTDAQMESLRAQQRIQTEEDQVDLADAEFSVQSATLDVKKAEVSSEIEGEKAKLALAGSQRSLAMQKIQIESRKRTQAFTLEQRMLSRKSLERDYALALQNIQTTLIKAPISGIFQALPNRRQGQMRMGGGGQAPPEFRQGDSAFAGANIGEIPDLTTLAVELFIDETARGRIAVGQQVRLKLDAFADSSVNGKIESIAALTQIDRTVVPPARTFRTVVSLDLASVKLGAKKPVQTAQSQTPQAGGRNGRGQGAPDQGDVAAQDPEQASAAGGAANGGDQAGGGRRGGSGGGQGGGQGRQRGQGGEAGAQGGQGAAQSGQGGGAQAQGGQQRSQGGQGGGVQAQGGQRVQGAPGGGGQGGLDPAAMEQMRQRFQNMSPEERQAAMGQARGGQGGSGGRGGQGGAGGFQRPQIQVQHLQFDEKKAAGQTAVGDVGLRPGMSTVADIVVDRLTNVVVVPARATFDKGGKVVVYVKKNNKFEPRQVVLGYKSEAQVQVVSGLQPGEIIALEEPAEAKGGSQ